MSKASREVISRSEQQTEQLAAEFAKTLKHGDVIAFRGGLGAGKTAFTRGLAQGLGAHDPVSSPTFAIAQVYRGGRLMLVHFDMYRIQDALALEDTGYYDYIRENDGVVYAIEWSENIQPALPDDTIYIDIQRIDDEIRKISIWQNIE